MYYDRFYVHIHAFYRRTHARLHANIHGSLHANIHAFVIIEHTRVYMRIYTRPIIAITMRDHTSTHHLSRVPNACMAALSFSELRDNDEDLRMTFIVPQGKEQAKVMDRDR